MNTKLSSKISSDYHLIMKSDWDMGVMERWSKGWFMLQINTQSVLYPVQKSSGKVSTPLCWLSCHWYPEKSLTQTPRRSVWTQTRPTKKIVLLCFIYLTVLIWRWKKTFMDWCSFKDLMLDDSFEVSVLALVFKTAVWCIPWPCFQHTVVHALERRWCSSTEWV